MSRWIQGVAVLAVAAVGLALLAAGQQARATHEQPSARDIEAACPPERVAGSGFEDIAGNPHEAAVECVAWWGVAQGQAAGAYGPAAPVRRDQMASFIYGLLVVAGVDVPVDPPQAFDDVGRGNVHATAVNALAELGVVSGHEDGTYRPDRRVRRDQMASFVSRSATHTLGEALTDDHQWFADVGEGNPHAAAVNGLAAAGIVQGGAGEEAGYAPGLSVRRDQMGSFLARTLDLLVAQGAATPPRAAQASLVDAEGQPLGEVTLTGRIHGQVEVTASLQGLPEGFHGFHLHQVGACEPDFTAAGGHHNPQGTAHGQHAGDLPVLPVRADGGADLTVVTDRISVDELLDDDGTAVIVHASPDNYANIPERYGGPDGDTLATGDAGARLACGVVEETSLAAPPRRPQPPGARHVGPDPGAITTFFQGQLQGPEGQPMGEVAFLPQRNGPMRVEAAVRGLPAGGFHGFHLHQTGVCEPDFAAAGGHYNPESVNHPHHAGDLPVLLATERGTAWLSFRTDRLIQNDLLAQNSRGVIVHASPDNYANIPERYGGPDQETLAGGDSGARIGCAGLEGIVLDRL